MSNASTESFGIHLRRLRLAAGLSQEELAERAGLTAAAIGLLERGERRRPYPHTLRALADALGLEPAARAAFFAAVPRRAEGNIQREREDSRRDEQRWSRPPVPLAPMVGREDLIASVRDFLRDGAARIVTLTGPGGIGKSRAAVEIAARLREDFDLGPVWVELEALTDPTEVLPAIGRALGLIERPTQDAARIIENHLEGRRSLLLLDGFDRLLAATPLITSLLHRCAGLALLVTSREALRIRGERAIEVPPLGLPGPEMTASAASVERAEAVALLLQRARAAQPAFILTDPDAEVVAAICARLDGIPLALELAAVQLKYHSPQALLKRLQRRLSVLEEGPRDLPVRQRDLRATIAWSYESLDPHEQRVFRRCSIFRGGFTAEAAEAICGEEATPQVRGALSSLVDKSLVRAAPDPAGETRFSMLETILEYAGERLAEDTDGPELARRHAQFHRDLVEAASPHLAGGSRSAWLSQLDREIANLRAALAWAAANEEVEILLGLAGGLAWYWILRGIVREGSSWTQRALACPVRPGMEAARGQVLYAAAAMAWKFEDFPLARRRAGEAVALLRNGFDSRRLALALALSGLIASSAGDPGRAAESHQESLAIFRDLEDSWGIAYAESNLADALLQIGETAAAKERYLDALRRFAETGDDWGRGIVLLTLGNVAWVEGRMDAARRRYEECVELFRGMGNDENAARGLLCLSAVYLRQERIADAERVLRESLRTWRVFESKAGLGACLEGLAAIRAALGNLRAAARLFAAAEVQNPDRLSLYAMPGDLFAPYRTRTEEGLEAAEFAECWAEGETMSLQDSIDSSG